MSRITEVQTLPGGATISCPCCRGRGYHEDLFDDDVSACGAVSALPFCLVCRDGRLFICGFRWMQGGETLVCDLPREHTPPHLVWDEIPEPEFLTY